MRLSEYMTDQAQKAGRSDLEVKGDEAISAKCQTCGATQTLAEAQHRDVGDTTEYRCKEGCGAPLVTLRGPGQGGNGVGQVELSVQTDGLNVEYTPSGRKRG